MRARRPRSQGDSPLSQIPLSLLDQRIKRLRHAHLPSDDGGAVALQPEGMRRVAATGDDEDHVLGLRGDGPRVFIDAVARGLIVGDFYPCPAAGAFD